MSWEITSATHTSSPIPDSHKPTIIVPGSLSKMVLGSLCLSRGRQADRDILQINKYFHSLPIHIAQRVKDEVLKRYSEMEKWNLLG